jgi:hypothetical protein
VREARLEAIAAAVRAGELEFTSHLEERLLDPERPRARQIRDALLWPHSEIIDDRPVGHYGPECLIWSRPVARIIHVCCSYPPRPRVITAYWPDTESEKWADAEFKRRVQR